MKRRRPGHVRRSDIASPPHLHTGKEIRLRPHHRHHGGRIEPSVRSEDLGVGPEGYRGSPPVGGASGLRERAGWLAPDIVLLMPHAIPHDLHMHRLRQRVHHRNSNAVQSPGGLVCLAGELSAGVKRGQDHLKGRLCPELRMRIDRDSATVVPDGQRMIVVELNLDPIGMASHRLVHRVVKDFRGKMVQRPTVGASDEHPGPFPDGLQTLKNLNCGCIVDLRGGSLRADYLETHCAASAHFCSYG